MLKVENLSVAIEDKQILFDISLEFKKGEIHAIMGRNGCGKSTFSKVLAGHPDYEIISGDILLMNKEGKYESILEMEPEERAHAGLFVGFQSPISIPGLDNESFLRTVFNNYREMNGQERMDAIDFRDFILEKMTNLGMSEEFLKRGVNTGFSGGERKKNEMLQLALLNPRINVLDEIDSGLDVDALGTICKDINSFRSQDNCFVLVTHYNRILKHLTPNYIHVFHQGKLVLTSNKPELAQQIEENGFESLLVGKE
ncbi:MAG: Fe-S cluster assembly ATPase SufC [Brevinema sp.]